MSRNHKPDTGKRVLHVTNIPTPYRIPFYRTLDTALRAENLTLEVCFLGSGNRERHWKVNPEETEELRTVMIPGGRREAVTFLVDYIRRDPPAAVVLSWAMDFIALRLLLFCRRRRIPCLIQTGETEHCAADESFSTLRALFRIPFFRLSNGFIAHGSRTIEYLRGRGVPEERIARAVNTVNTAFFATDTDRRRSSGEAERERRSYRAPDGKPFACHLLFVGYLLERKGLRQTLEALRLLHRNDVALHIVGTGAIEEELRRLVHANKLEHSVFFHGYRQTSELPAFYALADILLFPSLKELFGLVLVEGAAAGLPIVASRQAGGSVEVVREEVNGFLIDPRRHEEYAEALRRLIENPQLRDRMGAASRRHALEELSLERSAAGYIRGVKKVLEL